MKTIMNINLNRNIFLWLLKILSYLDIDYSTNSLADYIKISLIFMNPEKKSEDLNAG
jgi:hypothetical protein